MPNENDNLDQSQAAPTSIEEALLAMRKDNQQSTPDNVGDQQLDASGGTEESQQPTEANAADDKNGMPAGESGIDAGGEASKQETVQSEADNGSTGGYSTGEQAATEDHVEETYDYAAVNKAYIESIQQAAIQSANKDFRDNGVKKISINDLYEKDDSGRVSFKNPDNPGQYFSSRAEAQQWVDSINGQIDNEWRNTVRRYQNQYVQEIQPTLRLVDFAPQFDSMTPSQQDIFDEIIDPYAIKDRSGSIIGYSCDLNEAKRIALNIDAKTSSGSTQQTEQQIADAKPQGTGPAVDAATSGSDNSQNQDNVNPKNMAEAMKLVMEQEKKNRKK